MKCEKCGLELRIIDSKFKSEEGSTDVYCVQQLACVNPQCENKTNGIIKTVQNKVN